MTSLSLAPAALAEFDGPHAISSVDDIAIDTAQGFLASLIYVEGDYALYLDEEDTDLALNDATDRDLALIAGLLEVATERVDKERRIRRIASDKASAATAGW